MSARTHELTRPMPAAPDMEKGVISCILQHPDFAAPKALAILKAAHFHDRANGLVFGILEEMNRAGTPIEAATVLQTIMDRGLVGTVGAAFVADAYAFSPGAANVEFYARQVLDKHTRRRIVDACETSMEEAFQGDEAASDLLARTEGRILSLRGEEERGSRTMGGREAFFRAVEAIEKKWSGEIPSGTATGFPLLDAKNGGIGQGLTLIGSETSGGKSVLVLAWLLQLLKAGKRVRYYSLEMPKAECMTRFLCHVSGVHLSRLLNPAGGLSEVEMSAIVRATQEVQGFIDLMTISDDSDITASGIRAECRLEHSRKPIGAVLVDYIQKLTPEDPRAGREQQIAAASAQLKKLADDLEIPVITPVQLNKENGTRGSEALAMDADAFVRIDHRRDENGEPEEADSDGNRLCSLWVEKWRNGPRWYRIPAVLNGGLMTFREADPDEYRTGPKQPASSPRQHWRNRHKAA